MIPKLQNQSWSFIDDQDTDQHTEKQKRISINQLLKPDRILTLLGVSADVRRSWILCQARFWVSAAYEMHKLQLDLLTTSWTRDE